MPIVSVNPVLVIALDVRPLGAPGIVTEAGAEFAPQFAVIVTVVVTPAVSPVNTADLEATPLSVVATGE